MTNKKRKANIMAKYVCTTCGYVYDESLGDEENSIKAGTKFDDLGEDWLCPLCSLGKEVFEKE